MLWLHYQSNEPRVHRFLHIYSPTQVITFIMRKIDRKKSKLLRARALKSPPNFVLRVHSGLFCLYSEHGAKFYCNYDPFWITFINRLFSWLPSLKNCISEFTNSTKKRLISLGSYESVKNLRFLLPWKEFFGFFHSALKCSNYEQCAV